MFLAEDVLLVYKAIRVQTCAGLIAGARDGVMLGLEGKEYVVADGDVLHFRFAN